MGNGRVRERYGEIIMVYGEGLWYLMVGMEAKGRIKKWK